MRKIQLILVAVATLVAGSGVCASTLYNYNYYRKLTPVGSSGAFCHVRIDPQICLGAQVPCLKYICVDGELEEYWISRKLIVADVLGIQIEGSCEQAVQAN